MAGAGELAIVGDRARESKPCSSIDSKLLLSVKCQIEVIPNSSSVSFKFILILLSFDLIRELYESVLLFFTFWEIRKLKNLEYR